MQNFIFRAKEAIVMLFCQEIWLQHTANLKKDSESNEFAS